jgi:CRP-like cAMP-binding protein
MNQADVIGYAAALLVFVTFWMKTMVPLRTLGIASNLFFIVYGYLAGAYPPLLLHVLLLPLNLMRLREMLQLSRLVKEAASGNLNMDWLKPFSSKRRMQAGEVLFNKGETADRMFIIVSGRCRLAESGVDLAPGAVVGELALLSPDKTRTQTMQSTESGSLLEITYGQVRQHFTCRTPPSASISLNWQASACLRISGGSKRKSLACALIPSSRGKRVRPLNEIARPIARRRSARPSSDRTCDSGRSVDHGIGGTQALHQDAHHIQCEIRRAADQEEKLLLANWNNRRVSCRDRRCATGTVIDQRHLAENAALRQGIEQAVAEANLDRSSFDDEQLLRRVALAENELARFEAAHRRTRTSQDAEIDGRVRHSGVPYFR